MAAILNMVSTLVFMCVSGLMFYSIIRWIAVVLADRKDLKRRKKYATICGICMGIFVIWACLSFVLAIHHNTM